MNKFFDGISKPQLMQEFSAIIEDTEALLNETSNQTGDKISEVRAKISDSIRALRTSMDETEMAVMERSKAAAKAADVYVHDKPWQSVSAAAAIGFLVGWLASRR
jgi:ElaB/YqjD/DUF883 family membrane-anchored ribosome-binding protein